MLRLAASLVLLCLSVPARAQVVKTMPDGRHVFPGGITSKQGTEDGPAPLVLSRKSDTGTFLDFYDTTYDGVKASVDAQGQYRVFYAPGVEYPSIQLGQRGDVLYSDGVGGGQDTYIGRTSVGALSVGNWGNGGAPGLRISNDGAASGYGSGQYWDGFLQIDGNDGGVLSAARFVNQGAALGLSWDAGSTFPLSFSSSTPGAILFNLNTAAPDSYVSRGYEGNVSVGAYGAATAAASLSVTNQYGNGVIGDAFVEIEGSNSGSRTYAQIVNEGTAVTVTLFTPSSSGTLFTIDLNGVRPVTPSAQTIAAGNTITANACGGIKRITASGSVTTDTTNTFTAPAASNAGCVMQVCNSGSNGIALDINANFVGDTTDIGGDGDIDLTADDCVLVGSDGSKWRQLARMAVN